MSPVTLFKPFTQQRPITVPVQARHLQRGDVIAEERAGLVQPYVITDVDHSRMVVVQLDTGETRSFSPSVIVHVVTG
jgi:NMD protein affecting ribosome stability and mRNA decay